MSYHSIAGEVVAIADKVDLSSSNGLPTSDSSLDSGSSVTVFLSQNLLMIVMTGCLQGKAAHNIF